MLENKAERSCHNIDLYVDIAMVKNKESGDVSTLRALEPRALIPTAKTKKNKKMVKIKSTEAHIQLIHYFNS